MTFGFQGLGRDIARPGPTTGRLGRKEAPRVVVAWSRRDPKEDMIIGSLREGVPGGL